MIFDFMSNQRIRDVVIQNCHNCVFYFLDSLVVVSRTCRVFDSSNLELVFEQVDLRNIECYDVSNSKIVEIRAEPVLDNVQVYWNGNCSNNTVNLAELLPEEPMYGIKYELATQSKVPNNTATEFYVSHFNQVLDIFHNVYQRDGELTSEGIHRLNLLRGFVPNTENDIVKPDKQNSLSQLETLANTPFTMTIRQRYVSQYGPVEN